MNIASRFASQTHIPIRYKFFAPRVFVSVKRISRLDLVILIAGPIFPKRRLAARLYVVFTVWAPRVYGLGWAQIQRLVIFVLLGASWPVAWRPGGARGGRYMNAPCAATLILNGGSNHNTVAYVAKYRLVFYQSRQKVKKITLVLCSLTLVNRALL